MHRMERRHSHLRQCHRRNDRKSLTISSTMSFPIALALLTVWLHFCIIFVYEMLYYSLRITSSHQCGASQQLEWCHRRCHCRSHTRATCKAQALSISTRRRCALCVSQWIVKADSLTISDSCGSIFICLCSGEMCRSSKLSELSAPVSGRCNCEHRHKPCKPSIASLFNIIQFIM